MLIGITGKSCSGKNYISLLFKRKGFEVWDLDRVAEKIRLNKRTQIMEAFGTTDKKNIAAIVFSDAAKLKQLENIIYPELIRMVKDFKYDLVINGATLKHAQLDTLCDFIIYVDAPFETRLERAISRDHISREEFIKRDSAQNDIDYRNYKYKTKVFIVNNENECSKQIEQILETLGI